MPDQKKIQLSNDEKCKVMRMYGFRKQKISERRKERIARIEDKK
jgi:hypothetical protein